MSGACSMCGRNENSNRVLVTKSEGKGTFGRLTYRRKNNNETDLEEVPPTSIGLIRIRMEQGNCTGCTVTCGDRLTG